MEQSRTNDAVDPQVGGSSDRPRATDSDSEITAPVPSCDCGSPNCPARHGITLRPVPEAAPVHGEPPQEGFSYAKSQRIGQKAFALTDWFKARGERPDEWMDLFSEIVVSDRPPTAADIKRGQELNERFGWSQVEGGSLPNTRIRQAESPSGESAERSLPSSYPLSGDRLRALIQQWRYEATAMRKGRGLAAAALHACADELEQAIKE